MYLLSKNDTRRVTFFLGALLCVVTSTAQNILTIHQTDGQRHSFEFVDNPVIKYTNEDMILKTVHTEVYYSLSDIAKITYLDSDGGDFSNKSKHALLSPKKSLVTSIENNRLSINGAKPSTVVWVYGIDGKVCGQYKTDTDGKLTFNISELRTGVYIIKSDNQTCKIVKR